MRRFVIVDNELSEMKLQLMKSGNLSFTSVNHTLHASSNQAEYVVKKIVRDELFHDGEPNGWEEVDGFIFSDWIAKSNDAVLSMINSRHSPSDFFTGEGLSDKMLMVHTKLKKFLVTPKDVLVTQKMIREIGAKYKSVRFVVVNNVLVEIFWDSFRYTCNLFMLDDDVDAMTAISIRKKEFEELYQSEFNEYDCVLKNYDKDPVNDLLGTAIAGELNLDWLPENFIKSTANHSRFFCKEDIVGDGWLTEEAFNASLSSCP